MKDEEHPGSLPGALVPAAVEGETIASYASRIDAAIGAKPGHLWAIAVSRALDDGRRVKGKHVHYVPEDIAQQHALALCREAAGSSQADRLAVLDGRPKTVHHACTMCTHGAVAAIHPDSARLVCPVHHVWTGPRQGQPPCRIQVVPPPAEEHSRRPVDDAVVEAAERIAASAASPELIGDAFRRAASVRRRAWNGIPEPDDVPLAAAILATVRDTEVIRAVSDYTQPYRTAHDTVVARMEKATAEDPGQGADQAWLLLRWTAAAARHRWAGEALTEDPAPLVEPIRMIPVADGPIQPFDTYLDCLSTERRDDSWWNDRYRQVTSKTVCLCPQGHVTRSHPGKARRAQHDGPNCVLCTNRRVIVGYNSFADKWPALLMEWDPDADQTNSPWTVSSGSTKMGHWICARGHRYDMRFYNRALAKIGCPYCTNERVLAGFNDLATTHRALSMLWDPTAGNRRTPRQISAGNGTERMGWRCPLGHPFIRTTASLVASGGACPTCQGHILLTGFNDLATLRRDVAAEWHPTLNGDITPDEVTTRSNTVVWWLCPRGHAFRASIAWRCRYPRLKCPVENGHVLLKGVSDLASREPLLVKDWNYPRNGFPPDEIVPGNRKYWWTCAAGHTQYASVVNRRRSGGCTMCPPEKRVRPPRWALERGKPQIPVPDGSESRIGSPGDVPVCTNHA